MILTAVVLTCQMIFVRFVLNGSTVWQTEIVVFLVIAATLVGLPFVQFQRGHVNVDLIPLALKGKARFWLAVVTLALSIAITAVMLVYGYEYWHFAWARGLDDRHGHGCALVDPIPVAARRLWPAAVAADR